MYVVDSNLKRCVMAGGLYSRASVARPVWPNERRASLASLHTTGAALAAVMDTGAKTGAKTGAEADRRVAEAFALESSECYGLPCMPSTFGGYTRGAGGRK